MTEYTQQKISIYWMEQGRIAALGEYGEASLRDICTVIGTYGKDLPGNEFGYGHLKGLSELLVSWLENWAVLK